MSGTFVAYIPSPLWGEGRVRGEVVRGEVELLAVCESPRDFARGLRRRQTDAERRIWARLRDRRLLGTKFARQVAIGPYIVDFCCRERKLIVELDGGQHEAHADYDVARTAFLQTLGYRVLRFWDNDVLANTDGVLQRVVEALSSARPLTPTLSPEGRGGRSGDPRLRRGERVG